jgi:hypothetical protein
MTDHKKDAGRTLQLDGPASISERDKWWRKGKVLHAKTTVTQRAALDRAVLLEALRWLVAMGYISETVRCKAIEGGATRLGRNAPIYSKATPLDHEPQLSDANLDRIHGL